MDVDVVWFRKKVIFWGQEHFRTFPWRLTRDPYHILMAEVMLHRTQAPQVAEVYQKFLDRYPDVKTLAQASCDELVTASYSPGASISKPVK